MFRSSTLNVVPALSRRVHPMRTWRTSDPEESLLLPRHDHDSPVIRPVRRRERASHSSPPPALVFYHHPSLFEMPFLVGSGLVARLRADAAGWVTYIQQGSPRDREYGPPDRQSRASAENKVCLTQSVGVDLHRSDCSGSH